jgi:thymidylate synthase
MSRHIHADDPVDAWVRVVRFLDAEPRRSAYHLVVRVKSAEIDATKLAAINDLLLSRGKQRVQTVANTIFPSGLAATSADAARLAERYRHMYPVLKKFRGNDQGGTYFGRLVQFPDGGERSDQLTYTVEKMRRESTGLGRKTSIYECAIYSPKHDAGKQSGFPCLSSCAFHLDHDSRSVHLFANYRNHSVFERALGNYLGLAQLRDYVARQIDFEPGELMVTSGHAKIEEGLSALRNLLASPPF